MRLCLGQIRQNAEAKTEIGPPSSDRALYSDKARSFNQSERALYLNFIIYIYIYLIIYLFSPITLSIPESVMETYTVVQSYFICL